jgi:hypothetical protein
VKDEETPFVSGNDSINMIVCGSYFLNSTFNLEPFVNPAHFSTKSPAFVDCFSVS